MLKTILQTFSTHGRKRLSFSHNLDKRLYTCKVFGRLIDTDFISVSEISKLLGLWKRYANLDPFLSMEIH